MVYQRLQPSDATLLICLCRSSMVAHTRVGAKSRSNETLSSCRWFKIRPVVEAFLLLVVELLCIP